jgi:hypothetical protein
VTCTQTGATDSAQRSTRDRPWTISRLSFSDCDGAFFRSWTAENGGDRYQQGPGQVDRLWILAIEGRRLVIDATYMPVATEQDRAELAQVADSIAFKP